MKGPFESRHTSSERSAPGSSSHPGARSERGVTDRSRLLAHTCSGRLTSAMHLSEHITRDVLTLRLAHVRHIQRSTSARWTDIMRPRDTPHVERTSWLRGLRPSAHHLVAQHAR